MSALSPSRPLVPVSKLAVSEPYENYMSRSFQVTKDILSACKNSGEGHAAGPPRHLEDVSGPRRSASLFVQR